METSFLTIAEACEKTGRSASTVRRLIKSIADDDAHTDRSGIEPSPREVAAFKKKGENFTWKIREDILMKNFNGAPVQEKKSRTKPAADIFSILQKELELKNQQIEKQWEVIHSLNDRLREGNILMGSLQKRLALPFPEEANDVVVEVAASKGTSKGSRETSKKAQRKMFAWFRK